MTSERFKDLEDLRRFLTLSAERREAPGEYGFFADVYVSWKFTGADAKSDSELFIAALIHLVQDAQRRLNGLDGVELKAKRWDDLQAAVKLLVAG